MQRTILFLACFFININGFSQLAESVGQYPFVHYSPKDGLVNSRVRNIKQDSKGRMLFITFGGLSIYDGTRFTNYSQLDGLASELVNDVAEAGPDSFLVATNSYKLNTLVKGRIGVFETADGFCPVINHFLKSREGVWYAIADEGLFVLNDRKFIQIPLIDKQGIEIGKFLGRIVEWKNYLFLAPWSNVKERLIIYDKQAKKTVAISTDRGIWTITKIQSDQLWVSLNEGIKLLDTAALKKGKIDLLPLPQAYSSISYLKNAGVFLDTKDNLWLNTGGQLKIFSKKHPEQLITMGQGSMSSSNLTDIFQDREGIVWVAFDGKGIIKVTGFDVQLLNNFSGRSFFINDIYRQNDTAWLYNSTDKTILRYVKNEIKAFPLQAKINAASIYILKRNLYLMEGYKLACITDKDEPASYLMPQIILQDSIYGFGPGLVDPNGAFIINKNSESGFRLTVFKENKKLMAHPIAFSSDLMVLDRKGRLWISSRTNHLMVFTLHPEKPTHYLQLLKDFTNQLPAINPRSMTIDYNNNVWIGTRHHGLYCLKFDEDLTLQPILQFTTKNGLTDNFIYNLNCDDDNVIWIGTQTGLDKIFLKNDKYIIGNISKSNNFFQIIWKVLAINDSTVWALTNEGTILQVSTGSPPVLSSSPPLLLTSKKVNGQSIHEQESNFSYKQNNFTFHVAATSFIDEKSILYSYVLKGSGNDSWSEPSNNPEFNFVNLPAGKYTLQIRSDFPELMYPPQYLSYPFNIQPPWWQTWWFRSAAGLLFIILLISGIRFYYRRKLEKQRIILEKQQAVEHERARIAADMHDDLGAGLTNIKFLTEHMMEKTDSGETLKPDLEKLRNFSSELVESMGEIIWAVNEKNNYLSNTLYYLRSYAVSYCEENDLDCYFEVPANFKDRIVSGNLRRNIFLLLKESLHNIVKHSAAKNISITANVTEALELIIKDNGKGFSENGTTKGNGLINMKKRVQELNGSISFANDQGATVIIQLPLDPNQSTIG